MTCPCSCHNGPHHPCDITGGCGTTYRHDRAGTPRAGSDAEPCPGPCNRTWRNAARIDTDGNHYDRDGQLVHPVPGQPVWCRDNPERDHRGCQERIARDLRALPDLAASLNRGDGRLNTGATDTDHTRHGTRAGSPSGSPAWDTIDQVIRWAVDWDNQLRAHLGHASRAGDLRRTLSGSITYLDTHLTAALCAPFAIQFGRETHQLSRLLEHAAGRDRLRHRLPAPCPSCDRRALVRDDGSDQVDCTVCGRSWPESDYRRLTLILASEVAAG